MVSFVRPKLITFDVTGTLLKPKLELYEEIAMQHGLAIDNTKMALSFKSDFKKMTTEHPIFGKHTGLGWENWWRTILHNVYKDQHPNVSKIKLEKMASSLIRKFATSECWQAYPGATEILKELQKMKISLGVISNFDERLESILQSTNMRPYFSFVLTSYDLGIEKPNPLMFHEALKMAGNGVLPSEAIHVGDNVNLDYLAAKNAGWKAILVKHEVGNNKNDVVDEKFLVKNLYELKLLLTSLME